ncbi:MAG: Rpn family recombination-promoting nuclease/putative transposase [Clostridiales Family XIII bacterium]|jgi:predicted transposase/invertase (TIGR01784 family)|nr:Rpn family recombination-promoting nuclease/putative transposase [Clostridiales Family XIII bacterium]
MTELKYKFTYDTLFKLLFVKYPDLLKRLVAATLGIAVGSISEFVITNPEIPPEAIGDKFCRLDINMVVDGSRVNLEVQVENEGDYPERSLYYWARGYSSSLLEGKTYSELPRVIIISILDESVFDCKEYHSEFRPLEVNRHEVLSDRMAMHYFEIRKLPEDVDVQNELQLMLSLFRAKTEEELKHLERLEVSIVTQVIEAYREVTVSPEFKELERLRALARHNEASALAHARSVEAAKWQGVVAEQTARIAELEAQLEKN